MSYMQTQIRKSSTDPCHKFRSSDNHCTGQTTSTTATLHVATNQDFNESARLVKNAVTFAAGIAFSIVLTALWFSLFAVIVWQPIMRRNFRNSSAEGLWVSMSLALRFLSTRFTLKFPFSSSSCSQQCLTSRCFILPTPLLWQNALAASASVCKTVGRRPIPQNSTLYCISLASCNTSLRC